MASLKALSVARQTAVGDGKAAIAETDDLFDTYISEIALTFGINKAIEDQMKEAAKASA